MSPENAFYRNKGFFYYKGAAYWAQLDARTPDFRGNPRATGYVL